MPDKDDWDLQSMPELISEEEEAVNDISYLFNDSVEMMYLAKPVNESQILTLNTSESSVILTLNTSESSVTDNDPEESMFAYCNCKIDTDTSRDFIDDEEEMEEKDFLYIPKG